MGTIQRAFSEEALREELENYGRQVAAGPGCSGNELPARKTCSRKADFFREKVLALIRLDRTLCTAGAYLAEAERAYVKLPLPLHDFSSSDDDG